MGVARTTGLLPSCLALAAALLAAVGARADTLQEGFASANEHYYQGRYDAAAEGYEQLVRDGVRDADVYFNLALARARQGDLGRAILNFERALWIRPGDDAARQQLDAALKRLGKRRAEREGEATVRTRPPLSAALVAPLSVNLLAGLTLALNLLLFGTLLLRPRLRGETARLSATVAAALLAPALLLAAGGLAVKLELFADGRPAIVVAEKAALREGPDGRAQVRTHARAGQRARVLGSDGDYRRVRIPGSTAGWMKAGDLGEIRPN